MTAEELLDKLCKELPYEKLGVEYYDCSACLMIREKRTGDEFDIYIRKGRTGAERRRDNGEE